MLLRPRLPSETDVELARSFADYVGSSWSAATSGYIGCLELEHGKTNLSCGMRETLIRADKDSSGRPLLAPYQGRRQLQAVSGSQLVTGH